MSTAAVAAALAKASEGVDYTARDGAVCPVCGSKKLKVYKTMPWEGAARTRYHHCKNRRCVLHKLGLSVKSIQVDDNAHGVA